MSTTDQPPSSPPASIATAPEGADAYRLGEQLHAGSLGDVYEAEHPWLPGRYAIKILNPALTASAYAVDGFREELAAIASLRHPNIAQIIEVGTVPDGRVFVVMELLSGSTLAQRLADGRPMPLAEVLPIVRAVAGALQAAHSHQVMHRELMAENIFLAAAEGHEHGFVKLLNFGMARLRSAAGGDLGIAPEAAHTMAPEQAQGHSDQIDGRADQFALAAIAYRMLAGVDAFSGDDMIAVLYKTVHEPPPAMPKEVGVGASVEAVIRRGLAKDPGNRFDSVLAFARALETVATEAPVDEDHASRTPVVAYAGQLAGRSDGAWAGPTVQPDAATTKPNGTPPPDSADTLTVRARPAGTSGASWANPSTLPHVPALAGVGGGRFSEAAISAPISTQSWAAGEEDDLDDGEMVVPRQRGRLVIFLTALLTVAAGVAVGTGWRPPVAWRQSPTWHTLHLPGALTAPAVPSDSPPPLPAGATAAGDVANPLGTTAPGGPANTAGTGGESPNPVLSAALPPADAGSADATRPRDEAHPPKGLSDSQTIAPARAESATGAKEGRRAAATKESGETAVKESRTAATKESGETAAKEPRARRRAHDPDRDMVWSDKQQRLVPADEDPAPTPQDTVPAGSPPPTNTPPAPSTSPPPPSTSPSPPSTSPLPPRTSPPPRSPTEPPPVAPTKTP